MAVSRRSLAETYEAQDLIIQAAQDVKREATKAYREYLDGQGMDKDAIKAEVEGFKKAFRRKMDGQKKGTEAVAHVDAIADEIYLEITAPRAPRAARVENIEEFDAETGEITEPLPTKAAGQVEHRDPVALSGERGAATPSVENEAAEISTPITEQQNDPHPASDLTASSSLSGQVAPIQPEPVGALSEVALPTTDEDTGLSGQGSASGTRSAGGDGSSPSQAPVKATVKSVEPSGSAAPAASYPAPGVVVMEHTPPEGAVAHPYAACWPVNLVDPADGIREPIVKIGKLILDGRGRMFAARAVNGGEGIEYPVLQYAGTDPLMDCIRWNLASRPNMHLHNLKLIASKLVKLEPTRADEIMQAFGLEVAEAAQ